MPTFVHKPFKGHWLYEWQIGPLVFQFRHSDVSHTGDMAKPTTLPFLRRINIWRDSQWTRH
jgi:hypothetical protein